MNRRDRELLRRLSTVREAMAPVLLVLLDNMSGGELKAADPRALGEDFRGLGADLIARADELDRTVDRETGTDPGTATARPEDQPDGPGGC